ncbi:hypothetical protein BEN47_06440 [Hymenobacter lapidarius]|uniref:RCC1-like domain-containing protein n=1 Tax=Hymenobacter lapidarius TaxID=1908237 RepID=A0A1G1SQI4_9BACT|nr:hypothetical protein BEN47_06440 [Hymenobacter lapidarius]
MQVGSLATWREIAGGNSHTVATRTDESLWAWGSNGSGQMGSPALATARVRQPEQLGTDTNWQQAAVGNRHTVAVRTNGTLWAWGENAFGQLSDGTTTARNVPTQIGMATDWRSAAAGHNHTLAVRADGTLWAWGDNASSQLGDGTTTNRLAPVQIGTATNWQRVVTAATWALAVRTDGTLWVWGSSSRGLGLGILFGSYRPEPTQIGTDTNWQWIDINGGRAAAVRTDGTLWVWGSTSEVGSATALKSTSLRRCKLVRPRPGGKRFLASATLLPCAPTARFGAGATAFLARWAMATPTPTRRRYR